MKQFIATIDLRNANETDYARLHAALVKESFRGTRASRKAVSNPKNGGYFGEYTWSGNVSIQEVIGSLLKATRQTGRDYAFTVIRNKSLH